MASMTFWLRVQPVGKARPRVTSKGTYMPKAYQAWRRGAESLLGLSLRDWADGSIDTWRALRAGAWCSLSITIQTPTGRMRPDIDNAAGAIMDALQGAHVIANDRQVRRLVVEVVRGETMIVVNVEVME